MRYTVWSRGRLLGETDLGYVRCLPKHRMGDFFPTEIGERLMPVLTGPSRITLEGAQARAAAGAARLATPELQADLSAAFTHLESLELELRAPDGLLVPTESIGIQDTELLLQYGDLATDMDLDLEELAKSDPALAADIQHDLDEIEKNFEFDDATVTGEDDEPWREPPSYPRYQIQVDLLDDSSVP